MPNFSYEARDAGGKTVKGTMSATSVADVKDKLKQRKLTATQVRASEATVSFWAKLKGADPAPHIKTADLVIFTRQFATMIGAGIPIMECLSILQEQATDKGFKNVLAKIIEEVKGGSDLSSAMGRHPKVFERIYCNMIKAGEASGQIDDILVRLSEYMERAESLKRKIKSAMTYPVISLVMILGITIFLLVFIIPQFNNVFMAMKMELPKPTKFVLNVSNFMRNYLHFVLLGAGIFYYALRRWKKTENGAYQWDWLMLKMPVFGPLIQKVAIARFAKTFATLIQSGVPILGALEIVASTSGNKVLETAVRGARDSIRQGEPLAKPLAASPVFPPMVVRMISIGEKSGAVEQLLNKIAEFYDEQVSASVESLTALIEPMMIGIMGFIVGGIVMAIFMPIFDIQKNLAKK